MSPYVLLSFPLFEVGSDTLVPLMIFAVPIVAIVGGITAGIVRSIGQQRLMEMAQRERIAAIERGIDPSKLPPPPALGDSWSDPYRPYSEVAQRRYHGLLIGGIVTLFVGIGLMAMILLVSDERKGWAVGLVPASVGIALLLSAQIVKPKNGDVRPGGPPPPTS